MENIETVSPGEDGIITVSLDNYLEGAGVLKTTLPDEGGRQDMHGYEVQYQILAQVHGKWEPEHPDDASLVVLKIVPIVDNDYKDWFRHLTIRLVFEKETGSDPNDMEPIIEAYQPAQEGAIAVDHATFSVEKTNTYESSLNIKPPVDAVSGGLKATTSTKTAFEGRKLHTIRSRYERKSHKDKSRSVVVWEVTAIDKTGGVGDSITVAVLVRRAKGSGFAIVADTDGHIGGLNNALNKIGSRKKKVVRISPFGKVQKKPEGVDVNENDLHALSRGKSTALSDMVKSGVHLIETVAPVTYYPDKADSTPSPKSQPSSTPTPETTPSTPPQPRNVKPPMPTIIEESSSGAYVAEVAEVDRSVGLLGSRAGSFRPISRESDGPHDVPTSLPASLPAVQLSARADRHRKMAGLYELLAKLHREEAEEALARAEAEYSREIEISLK